MTDFGVCLKFDPSLDPSAAYQTITGKKSIALSYPLTLECIGAYRAKFEVLWATLSATKYYSSPERTMIDKVGADRATSQKNTHF